MANANENYIAVKYSDIMKARQLEYYYKHKEKIREKRLNRTEEEKQKQREKDKIRKDNVSSKKTKNKRVYEKLQQK